MFKPLLVILLLSLIASGTPIDDLASSDQVIRETAAAELRTTFKETPKTKWTAVVGKMKAGQTKVQILELLQPFKVTEESGYDFNSGFGRTHTKTYRLDSEWILNCGFQDEGDILIGLELVPSMKYVWVEPPEGFTGTWVTYFINGEKARQVDYVNGNYFGTLISYYSSGAKAYEQHYTAAGCDGEDTGYFPSGRISYRAHYKTGKPVGTWIWYDEDGNIRTTREH